MRQGLELCLVLRTRIEPHLHMLRLAWGYLDGRQEHTRAVLLATQGTSIELALGIIRRIRRDPGRNEMVLNHADPTIGGRLHMVLFSFLNIGKIDLLELSRFGIHSRSGKTPDVSGFAIRFLTIMLKLKVGIPFNGRRAQVIHHIVDIDNITATVKGVGFDYLNTTRYSFHADLEVILAGFQVIFARLKLIDGLVVDQIVTDKPGLGEIAVVGAFLKQLEQLGLVGNLVIGVQGKVAQVAAVGIDSR